MTPKLPPKLKSTWFAYENDFKYPDGFFGWNFNSKENLIGRSSITMEFPFVKYLQHQGYKVNRIDPICFELLTMSSKSREVFRHWFAWPSWLKWYAREVSPPGIWIGREWSLEKLDPIMTLYSRQNR